MKDYLNAEECNDFLIIRFAQMTSDKILKEWIKNLNKEEATFLKYVNTYSEKFFKTIGDRLSIKEKEKINKRMSKFQFMLVDDYQYKKTIREVGEVMKNAVIPRDDFDELCMEIMDINCRGCEKHWCDCKLHKVFEENLAPAPTGFENDNCRYAYNKELNFNRTVQRVG